MNNKMSRVSLIKSLNKKQLLNLLGSLLSFEELEDLLKFENKEQVIKIISSIYAREALNDIVNSNLNISTNLIFNYYNNSFCYENQNANKQISNENQLFTEIKKVALGNENHKTKTDLQTYLENENKNEEMKHILGKSKNNLGNENKTEGTKKDLGDSKMKTETKNDKAGQALGNEIKNEKMENRNEKMKNIFIDSEPVDLSFENLENDFIIPQPKIEIQNKKFGVINDFENECQYDKAGQALGNKHLELPLFKYRTQKP